MIWISLLALIVATLLQAGQERWSPEGWARAWLFLVAQSAVFRFLIWAAPSSAPFLARGITLASLCALTVWAKRHGAFGKFRIPISQIVFPLMAGLIMARNAFPNFDVDSLSYHLASVRWLLAKGELPDLQAHARGVYLAFRFVGFEEFLTIPAVDGNLALWAGLFGGWTKVLVMFSVLSIVPAAMPFFRYLAVFLLLIDDHFFFSGQNHFVYLQPALIGLVIMAFWFLWRGLRGKPSAWPLALGLFLGIAYDKYHGLFFVALGGVFAILSLAFPGYRGWFKVRKILSWLRSPAVWIGLAGCFALYGLNWIETGSPIYPYFANGIGGPPAGALQSIESSYFKGGSGELLRHFLEDKYKVFTYPGNLALKYLVLLFFPALLLWVRRPRRLNSRMLEFVVYAFLVTVGWILMCNMINYETSRFHGRYPRFVFALTILGIAMLGNSARNLVPWLRTRLSFWLQNAAGLCLLLWIALTFDTRYFNVTRGTRIGWPELAAYWHDPAPFEANTVPSVLLPLTDDFLAKDLPVLKACVAKAAPAGETAEFLDGKEMVIVDARLNWPNYFFGGNALRPDQNVGENFDLSSFKILIVSKKYMKALPERLAKDATINKLRTVWNKKNPLCESDEMRVF
ncbi:MAG: hypothetical protein ACXVCZ_10035, partial [Bdellovibrionota bacterium]